MPSLLRIAPEVQVVDLSSAIRYYESSLGFRLAMTMPSGDYAIVERDDVAIHLFETPGNRTRASLHIFAEGITGLHEELKGLGARVTQDVVQQPWGNRDFRVLDDSGNELKFTEPLPR